jgi:hypothetical protein
LGRSSGIPAWAIDAVTFAMSGAASAHAYFGARRTARGRTLAAATSSTTPLQSLSIPSATSGMGGGVMQVRFSPSHTAKPEPHAPFSPVEHALGPTGRRTSTNPSSSSSLPLHAVSIDLPPYVAVGDAGPGAAPASGGGVASS